MYERVAGFGEIRAQIPAGDRGVRATLDVMRRLAREGARQFLVRQRALEIVHQAMVPGHDHESELRALFEFVRDRITFRRDIAGVETLQSPRVTLAVGAGDCDDKATLLAALLISIGIGADLRFRVVAVNPRSPGTFSHVLTVARLNGREIKLDPTYSGTPLGWAPRGYRSSEVLV